MLAKPFLYHLPLLSSVLFHFVSTNTYDEENNRQARSSTRPLLTVITTRGGDVTQEKKYDAEYIENRRQLPGSYQLFYVKNTDWCAPLPDTVHIPKYGNGWVALIPDDETRKNCTCADKLRTAKSYNASAAIVLFSYCGIRPSDSPKLPLTAITVNRVNGLEIIDIYKQDSSRQVLCEISKQRKKHKDKQFRVVLRSFILLMCISLAWLVFYYVQRFRHIYRNDRKERQLLNAAKKAISKLKTAPFNSALSIGDDCAICLGNYKDGETVRILPCKHLFHKSCIDPWLLNHRTCPLCKNNILKSLGVEIPDNINLTHYDVDSNARASSRDVEADDHSVPIPSSSNNGVGEEEESSNLVTLNTPVEALLPSASVFATTTMGAGSSSQASWGESVHHHHHHHHHHHGVSASVSSSTSSMLSDTDSERSTVALVSAAQKV